MRFDTLKHYEEEQLNLEVFRKQLVGLKNAFIVASVLLVVLIAVANVAAIYLHKTEDHAPLVVSKDFANVTYLDYNSLEATMYAGLKAHTARWGYEFWGSDALYAAYSEKDLDEFLAFAAKYPFAPYSLENHDCDDFAIELHGLERLWYSRKDAKPYGSTFGIMIGDLRCADDDPSSRKGHAMNLVLLHDLR